MPFLDQPSGHSLDAWVHRLGLTLDPIQQSILDPAIRRGMLNCCRKWGKSTMIALKAAHFAATHPEATILIAAPSSRQSEELLGIAARFLRDLDQPATHAQQRLTLPNRARILALPNQPETIRGYSPQLLVIDEAAYLSEELWDALFPMLNAAPHGGTLWLMSTPAQPSGFFHRLWTAQSSPFTRVKVTAYDCPRIPAAVIEEARAYFPPDRFAREYLCEFAQPATAAFPEDMVRACLAPDLPEFLPSQLLHPLPAAPFSARPHDYLGVDFGQSRDSSALAIVEFAPTPTYRIDPVTRAPLFDCSLYLRHLESPPLGTPFTAVVDRAKRLAIHPRLYRRATLIPDASGLGKPIVEMFHQPPQMQATFVPVVIITGGHEVRLVDGFYRVPKQHLMTRLEDLLRRKKLRIAPGPLTDALLKELTSLDREIRPSGSMVYSTPSAGHHDDLVMATALAAWRAWEMHSRYLQPDSPVSIFSDTGVWWK